MSVVGLHPEELFDKEARGALSDSERERLEAHVAQCGACRVERLMRADFAEEMADDDDARVSLSALLAFDTVEKRALASGEEQARAETPVPIPVAAPRPRRFVKTTWLLVAAALSAVSVAGATGVGQRVWARMLVASDPAGFVAAPAPTVTKPARTHVAHHAPAPAPAESPASSPSPTPVDVLVSAPIVAAPARAVRPREGAAALFDDATAARRRGDYAHALAIHRELKARFPASREAQVGRATVGRLLLDLGDPSGALASFDEYLSSGSGELGEETMVGRATALERLGRADDARRGWQALLAAYPDSPYAAHAMRRIGSQSVR